MKKLILSIGIAASLIASCSKPSTQSSAIKTPITFNEAAEKPLGEILKTITIQDGILKFNSYSDYMNFKVSLTPSNFKEIESLLNNIGHTSYYSTINPIMLEVNKYDSDINLDVTEIIFLLEQNSKYFTLIEDGFKPRISGAAEQLLCNKDMIFGIGDKLFFFEENRYSTEIHNKKELLDFINSGNITTNIKLDKIVLEKQNTNRANGNTPTSFSYTNTCGSGAQKLRVTGDIGWAISLDPTNSSIAWADAIVDIKNWRRGRDFGIWGGWHLTANQSTKWISVTSSGLSGGTQNHVDIFPAQLWQNNAISVFATSRANFSGALTGSNFWGSGVNNATILRGGNGGQSGDNLTVFTVNWNGWGSNTFNCNGMIIDFPAW